MMFNISAQARREMLRRGIPEAWVRDIMENPGQIVPVRGEKKAYQSLRDLKGKKYLVRVIVADDKDPCVVVTVYLTSKIAKYWRPT
ncbi:MAG: DUF4258 domain-containing protein [Gemmatimonadetes bacterium]|nr:DUF4258 domain-containing protein [Gemmatimonadota bacterium]